MTARHDCSGIAYDVTGFHRCFRNATVERDGDWWCWQHDPERVETDRKKRRAAWAAKADRRADIWEHRARNARLAALVTPDLPDLLEQLAKYANLYDAPHSSYEACALAARIREALALEANE